MEFNLSVYLTTVRTFPDTGNSLAEHCPMIDGYLRLCEVAIRV